MEIEALANEVVRIIKNLKPERGNMTGIFAQWGRGKTRLMNEIWKRFSGNKKESKWSRIKNYLFKKGWKKKSTEKKEVEYIQIEYQAWRYQDTPASWAYLYEQFSLKFLGNKKGLKNFISYHIRLLKLNIERDGLWNLVLAILLSSLAVLTLSIKIPDDYEYKNLIVKIGVPTFGFLIGIGIKNFNRSYFSKAINLIRKYGIKTTFTETLGIQAEIQKELIHLVNTWIKPKSNKKLVLFVDDLDRCSGEKAIEIIDALRIMLDDDKLKDKLLVITAIDERILQLAVFKKYEYAINHPIKHFNENDLVREYIDKLFIFSVKLGSLTKSESQEFFEKLTNDDAAIEPEKQVSKGISGIGEENRKIEIREESNIASKPAPSSPPIPDGQVDVQLQFEKIDKLSREVIDMFKSNLGYINNSTPRKIRILYYRYLFAKNLLILRNSNQNENSYWLSDQFHDIFIRLLIDFSQKQTSYIEEQRRKALASDELMDLEISVERKVSSTEYVELLKVFELTIAY